MTYNNRSKTMSLRIDPAALKVLEWDAAQRGAKLRTEIREELEERAERISEQYDLDFGPEPEDPITRADLHAPDPGSVDDGEPEPGIDVQDNYDPDGTYSPGPPDQVTQLHPAHTPTPPQEHYP